jgi:hypothetical protein
VVLFWLQVPVPEQVEGGWYVVPLHDAARPHDVDAGFCSQAPAMQKPVLPQTPLAAQFGGSACPLGTLAHVPVLFTLHD